MVLGLLLAGTVAGIGAVGVGLAAAHRVHTAYDRTIAEMYNQQAYYPYSGSSGHHHYYQPQYYQSGHSYNYYR